jgi:prolyl-tRNA synthetase
MHIPRQEALSQTTQYLYDRLKSLPISGDYHLSDSLTQQIQALSTYKYTSTANGDMRDFFVLLKDADIVDMDYAVNGCAIWLPHGVKYKNQFVSEMSKDLVDYNYEEYLFPNLVSPKDFATLCDEIYDFDNQALKVSAHTMSAVLKPTGESAIYPTVARWLKEGKRLPLRIFQAGPYFRYKSGANAWLRPIECSFMLEAHGIFASKNDMNDEFERALEICGRWARLLCMDAFVVSRPVAFNKPVSTKTVGFDVLLPNGKTIQAVMAYLQSQIFSRPYGVTFNDKGKKKATEQMTFGITERTIYTSLVIHADDLGLRLPATMAPEQVWIVCRDQTELSRATAEKLQRELRLCGIRTAILPAALEGNPFEIMTTKGTPLQLILDDVSIREGMLELFDRRSLHITPIKLSSSLPAAIKSILLEGDEMLLQEQSIKKVDAIQMFNPDDIAQLRATATTQKRCFQAVVHEDNACIDKLQTLGLGEYIGTDQSAEPLVGQYCYSCGKACTTFGYLTKRL